MANAAPKRDSKMEKRKQKERERIEKEEDVVEQESDQSFPASDPPSWTGVTGPEVVDEDELEKEAADHGGKGARKERHKH